MAFVRFSSARANYVRGGLHFRDGSPDVKRMPDGRLAIVLGDVGQTKLGEQNFLALAADPNIKVDRVGPDGLTATERKLGKQAQARQRQTIKRVSTAIAATTTAKQKAHEKRVAALQGNSKDPAST